MLAPLLVVCSIVALCDEEEEGVTSRDSPLRLKGEAMMVNPRSAFQDGT